MNNMNETWERWEPIVGLAEKYYVECIQDDMNIFRARLYDKYFSTKRVDIIFHDQVDAYRRTAETLRYQVVLDLDKRYGHKFYATWTLFKVTHSRYIKWLSEESGTISDHMSLVHFVILAADSLVDIVTTYEPKVQHVIIEPPVREDTG